MKEFINKHKRGVWSVFTAIAFVVYTWSIIIILWDMPALLLRMKGSDIVGYIAYQLMYAYFESMIVTFAIVILSVILPKKHLQDNLSISGSLLIFSVSIIVLLYKAMHDIRQWVFNIWPNNDTLRYQFIFGIYFLITILLPIYALMLARNERVSRVTKNIIEHLLPLIGIYVFLSGLSIFVVIYRNIR